MSEEKTKGEADLVSSDSHDENANDLILQGIVDRLTRNYSGFALVVHRRDCEISARFRDDEDGHTSENLLVNVIRGWNLDVYPPELSQELLVMIAGAAVANAKASDRGYKNRLRLAEAAKACLDDLTKPERFGIAMEFVRGVVDQYAPEIVRGHVQEQMDQLEKQLRRLLLGEDAEPAENHPAASAPQQPEWAAVLEKQFKADEEAKKAMQGPALFVRKAGPEVAAAIAADPDSYGGEIAGMPILRYAPGEATVKATCRLCGTERKFSANDPRVPDAIWGCSTVDCPNQKMPDAPKVALDALVGHVVHLIGSASSPKHLAERQRPVYTFVGITCNLVEHVVFANDLPHEIGFLRFVEKTADQYLTKCSCGQQHVAEVFACTVAKQTRGLIPLDPDAPF